MNEIVQYAIDDGMVSASRAAIVRTGGTPESGPAHREPVRVSG